MAFAAGSTPGRIGRMGRGSGTRASEEIGRDGKPCEEAQWGVERRERGDAGGNAGHYQQGRGRRQFGER
eukprot:59696-Prymnesium_polylepis.1